MSLTSLQRWLHPSNARERPAWTSLMVWLSSGTRPSAHDDHARRPALRLRRHEALGAARLEFSEALYDVHSLAAGDTLDRIALCRSLHELWHLREEIFSHVACRHAQAEATRRLAELDRHFPRRGRHAILPPPHPLRDVG